MTDPLALLSRSDKWYLGSGDGLIWAPPFPAWHDTPGFWDDAHLAQYPVGPLFTLSFVGSTGEAALPRALHTRWTPVGLALAYRLGPGLRARELRSAPGNLDLASEWSLENRGRRSVLLHVVLWTAVDGDAVADSAVTVGPAGLELIRSVRDRKRQQIQLRLRYQLVGGHASWAAYRSEGQLATPAFASTPFYDRWPSGGGLHHEAHLGGIDRHGLVYVGLHRPIRIAGMESASLIARVELEPMGLLRRSRPGRSGHPRPSVQATWGWNRYAASIPALVCSDEAITRFWWYRWYGLRLNGLAPGLGQYGHPAVCEGIGYFHQPISYSAMCHVRELRWLEQPLRARGVIDTFFEHQASDGAVPGRVYLDHLIEPDFYHSDWGGAVADLDANHPGGGWLTRLYPKLAAYAEWLLRTRDRDGSGMIDVTDQYETGQEYMSRYQAVDPEADRYGWENRIRLKGIDVTVYAYRLLRLLGSLAPAERDRARWAARAERTRAAVQNRMWDPVQGLFFDVDPRTAARTGAKAAVCFYPYLTDLIEPKHVERFGRHLFNPREFWTPFPVPSSSVDDPRFSPDAEWKGKRHVCPWNGRVWPMTNSHVIDALARVVRWHRPDWAPRLVYFLKRFLAMLTFDGDPRRPNSFEHYHPYSGRASVYRGIDDYQHSWINDLLVRHVAGLLPRGAEGIVVDPMPFGLDVALRGVRIASHRVDVTVRAGAYRVRIDGRAAGGARVGRALDLRW